MIVDNRITVCWANRSQTAILVSYHQPWSWEDLERSIQASRALMDMVNHKVDIVIDMRQSSLPTAGAIWRLRWMTENKHKNRDRMIFVGANPVVESAINLARRAYSSIFQSPEYVFAPSLEDALRAAAR